jgi:hypothetical protein
VLDLTALAMLGPVSPADAAADVDRLYGERAGMVLASRFVHCLGLVVALWLLALLLEQLRERGGSEAVSRIAYGGLASVVAIEVVRNVMIAALALRYDEFGTVALPMHVVAVLLGPAIAFPIAAALGALAWQSRSQLMALLAAAWVVSGVRVVSLSSVLWYGGLAAFVGLLVALAALTIDLSRPVRS